MKHLVLVCVFLLGCRNEPKTDATSAQSAMPAIAAAPKSVTAPSAEALVAMDCLPCHDQFMLEQQRLTAKQWGAVVKKMQGWGSLLAPDDIDKVVTYLSNQYPATGPEYTVPSVPITEVAARFGTSPDGVFGGGDPRRGEMLFKETCVVCHGPKAQGAIGVALVNRLVLQHPADFAAIIRKGRGRMVGNPAMPDADVGALLAYLRAQKPQ